MKHLFYLSLFGLCLMGFSRFYGQAKSELSVSRKLMIKESVKSLQAPGTPEQKKKLAAYVNKNIAQEAPKISFFREDKDGNDYWCRAVDVKIAGDPPRCLYEHACFGCQGRLYPPEIATATPICADGDLAKNYDAQCCPNFSTQYHPNCPEVAECFKVDLPPSDGCNCDEKRQCKFKYDTSKYPRCQCEESTSL